MIFGDRSPLTPLTKGLNDRPPPPLSQGLNSSPIRELKQRRRRRQREREKAID